MRTREEVDDGPLFLANRSVFGPKLYFCPGKGVVGGGMRLNIY